MKLKLVKASQEYRQEITDMLDEWHATGEKIVPYAIRRLDYHDFEFYCDYLECKGGNGWVPDSTFFCLDEERGIMVGAVNIRHYLNDALLLNGGHYRVQQEFVEHLAGRGEQLAQLTGDLVKLCKRADRFRR